MDHSSWEASQKIPHTLWNQTSTALAFATELRSNLILCFRLSLCLPSDLFPSGLSTKTPHTAQLFPPTCQYPVHLIICNLVTRILRIWWGLQINSAFNVPFLPAPCYLVPPTPKYLFSHINTLWAKCGTYWQQCRWHPLKQLFESAMQNAMSVSKETGRKAR
jgi:hypothetical protein